jgi:single-strand DNA-binding protein
MAGETLITVVGNLVDDPELRFTPSGAAVANFRIASTPRTFDRQSNEWKDGEALFLSCSVWRQAAENVAESLQKGMRVVVQGRLKQRSYETREGEKRTVVELDVDEVGPSLKYATAKVARVQRSGGGGGYNSQGGGGDDPWASSPAQGGAPAGGQAAQPAQGAQPAAGGQAAGGQGGSWGGQQGGGQPAQQNDPWASGGGSDEPPF